MGDQIIYLEKYIDSEWGMERAAGRMEPCGCSVPARLQGTAERLHDRCRPCRCVQAPPHCPRSLTASSTPSRIWMSARMVRCMQCLLAHC